MKNLEPDTEAGSSHDEFPDSIQNISGISFNEVEEGKVGLGTDQDMFPNFDHTKGKDGDQKRDL